MLEEWTIGSLFVLRERFIEASLLMLRHQVSVNNVHPTYNRELVRVILYFSSIGDDLRPLVFLSASKDLLRSSLGSKRFYCRIRGTCTAHSKTANITIMSRRPINLSGVDVEMRDVEMPSCKVESIQQLDGREDKPLLLQTRTIFLSHSGSQGAFVEQLYWDLSNRGHTVFFDKSSDSLPRGKAFPELIVEATRQCVIAVVVLSEQYLMSKWPMLELVAFVDAQSTCNPNLDILPLFYKLNVGDLKDVRHLSRWKAEWQRLAAIDARVNAGKCEDALRILNRRNGERFSDYAESEFSYRKAIVRSLYKLSGPYLKYCRPPMVGRSRLSQIIIGELERQSRVNSGRHAVLGLYGLGGMGKTLLCKALCSHFREQYAGRVCHVECSKSLGSLELQNLILDELANSNKSRPFKTCEEALELISQKLPHEAIFLALDNVQEGDLEWLQSIFNPRRNHNPKSKFVVTSRCFSNVQSIVRDKDLCWAIPSLTENEALELFVRSAAPTLRVKIPRSFSTDQQTLNILKGCIKECLFSNDVQDCLSRQSSVAQGHYNPMLLQILGSSIKETKSSNPVNFIEKCKMWGKLQHFHKHPVFEILRTEYDALSPQRCKLLFLDVALFAPREKLRKLDDLCAWLEEMNDCDREEILHNLRKLRRSSLIEDWETNAIQSQILFHDLYKDFAAYELQQVEADKRWAVYHTTNLCGLPQNLEASPPGRNWPDLIRVSLRIEPQLPTGTVPQPNLQVLQSIVLASPPVLFPSRKKIQQWENVQLLCLEGFESRVLDISPLRCLRSLKLVSYELRTLKGCDKVEQLRFVELNCSGLRDGLEFSISKRSKLQELVTGEIYSLQSLRLPGSAGSGLKVCKLHGWNKALPVKLDLSNHCLLREVVIAHSVWDSGLASLWGSWSLSLLGLQFLTKLVDLTLVKLPIGALPGLENLVELEVLNLRGCAKLEVLPDLRTLLKLVRVDRHGCEKLPIDQPRVSRGCVVIT